VSKVLVTGGAGFIGSNLVEALLARGDEVRVLDNFATGSRANLASLGHEVEVVEGDLRSYERVHTAVRGVELVFHQGALGSVPRSVQDPLTSTAVNVEGTVNVLLAARDEGVRRVVFASSSSVYGDGGEFPRVETQAPNPISPYAVAKLAGEGYARTFAHVYGLETVSLRYFNVFGARQDPLSQYAAVIPNFISAFMAGDPPRVFGDGNQTRDFTHVENAVEANLLAIDAPQGDGRVYNVACGERISVNRVIGHLRELTGKDLQPVNEPGRPGEVRDSLADLGRANSELGYVPRVGFEEGLGRTLEHFRTSRDVTGVAPP
jgi:UDP-glucose 4-epimerase